MYIIRLQSAIAIKVFLLPLGSKNTWKWEISTVLKAYQLKRDDFFYLDATLNSSFTEIKLIWINILDVDIDSIKHNTCIPTYVFFKDFYEKSGSLESSPK